MRPLDRNQRCCTQRWWPPTLATERSRKDGARSSGVQQSRFRSRCSADLQAGCCAGLLARTYLLACISHGCLDGGGNNSISTAAHLAWVGRPPLQPVGRPAVQALAVHAFIPLRSAVRAYASPTSRVPPSSPARQSRRRRDRHFPPRAARTSGSRAARGVPIVRGPMPRFCRAHGSCSTFAAMRGARRLRYRSSA